MIEEVDDVKNASGWAKPKYLSWMESKWNDISTSSFAELESQIFEVENLNESFRFLKGKSSCWSRSYNGPNGETSDGNPWRSKGIAETEERNSLAVQQALDVYEELKEKSEKTSMNTDQLFWIAKQIKVIEKNLRSLWL